MLRINMPISEKDSLKLKVDDLIISIFTGNKPTIDVSPIATKLLESGKIPIEKIQEGVNKGLITDAQRLKIIETVKNKKPF